MSTTTPALTAEQFLQSYGNRSDAELVRGELVRTSMPGPRHGEICTNTALLIGGFVKAHRLGRTGGNDSFVRLANETIRGADLYYISYETLPKEVPTPALVLETAPDLVVEVRSPSDRLKAVIDKGQEYLEAGVKAVMIVEPETESVGIFRTDELPIRFHNGDTVTLPEILPGFSAPVKAFFE